MDWLRTLKLPAAVHRAVFNPLLVKELRTGLRERKMLFIYTLFLGILSVILYVVYANYIMDKPLQAVSGNLGLEAFRQLMTYLVIGLVLLAPTFTAGLLSMEKERKTYDMLVTTLLSPWDIVWGKLAYGLIHVAMLLIAAMPIAAILVLWGGITPLTLLSYLVVFFLAGGFVCQVALFISARESKSANAVNLSYGLLLLLGLAAVVVLSGQSETLLQRDSPLLLLGGGTLLILPWLGGLLQFSWLSGFLFVKTANHIQQRAVHIKALHILFLVGFGLNLLFFTLHGDGIIANATGDNLFDQLGEWWARVAMAVLFAAGFFLTPAAFASRKDQAEFDAWPFSKPYSMVLALQLALALPALYFAFTSSAGVDYQLACLALVALMVNAFYLGAKALAALLRDRLPVNSLYFLMFSVSVLATLPGMLYFRDNDANTVPFWSLAFLNPYLAVTSLWEALSGRGGGSESPMIAPFDAPFWTGAAIAYIIIGALAAAVLMQRSRKPARG